VAVADALYSRRCDDIVAHCGGGGGGATRALADCVVVARMSCVRAAHGLMDLNRPTGLTRPAARRSPRHRRRGNYTTARAATASIMHQSRDAAGGGGRAQRREVVQWIVGVSYTSFDVRKNDSCSGRGRAAA